MVRITYQPWEEIVIHEVVQYSMPALLEMQSFGVPPGSLGRSLMWANEVAFTYAALPANDEVVADQLKGKMHWGSVAFTLMPTYENAVLLQNANVRIPVADVSGNPTLYAVARWLAEQSS